MATKKQKREAAEAKHKAFMEAERLSGLEAQRKDRAERKRQELNAWQEQHEKKHSWKKRVAECPHCQIIASAVKRGSKSAQAKSTISNNETIKESI